MPLKGAHSISNNLPEVRIDVYQAVPFFPRGISIAKATFINSFCVVASKFKKNTGPRWTIVGRLQSQPTAFHLYHQKHPLLDSDPYSPPFGAKAVPARFYNRVRIEVPPLHAVMWIKSEL